MANNHFNFKQFSIQQDKCAMKVTTDACIFGAIVAEEVKNNSEISNALDIGTGTSLLAQMIAQQTNFPINAIEIDQQAFEQASENLNHSAFSNRIKLVKGDIKSTSFDERFDLIFSNPPFYEADLKSPSEQKNIAHHDKGLTFEELSVSVDKNLTDEGICFLLIPFKREEEMVACLRKYGLGVSKIIRVQSKPTSPFSRSILMISRTITESIACENFLVYELDGSYSASCKTLLSPYYLFL